jgi:hypothetical protein
MSLQPILSNNKELFSSVYKSNLKADAVLGSGEITVYNIAIFAINYVICIGEYGKAGSEIIKTHVATAPTGSTVTLASNLVKDHAKDVPVYVIPFDQIEFSWSATSDGVKTVLSTDTIDPEQEEMVYQDTSHTSGYYFTRFKNSITSVYSNYSDPYPYEGLPENTVGYAIDTAMNELGVVFGDTLNYTMFIGWANEMLRNVRGKLNKWNNFFTPGYILGQVSLGVRRWALPDDCYNQNSNSSIANVKIGNEVPLFSITRAEYLQAIEDTTYTEIATQPSIGDTSLVLDDTSDLDESGSLDVFVSGTKYTITYTAKDDSTNTLSGIPDSGDYSISYAFPVDSPCWQGLGDDEDYPSYYSVFDGYLYLWPLISSDYEGKNITIDYYTDIVSVDSDADVITGPRFDMLKHYFKWKIRTVKENKGKEDMKDPSYLQYKETLVDAIRLEPLSERNSFAPRASSIYGGRSRR